MKSLHELKAGYSRRSKKANGGVPWGLAEMMLLSILSQATTILN